MRSGILLLCGSLSPWFLAAQQNAPHQMAVHKYPSDHFSISIPTGWVEIPKAELDQMSANIREAAPNARPQPYNYGFQESADSKYARVLVQVKTTGRWSPKVFDQIPKVSSLKGDVVAAPGLAALKIQLGKLTYDPTARIAYLRMQFTGDDGQTMQGFSGLHPTKVGSIQVNCYASTTDFDKDAALFAAIITSVQIDNEWEYQATGASPADLGPSAVTGATGGTAAILVLWFLLRRKQAAKSAILAAAS
jgi:hypothetical protein